MSRVRQLEARLLVDLRPHLEGWPDPVACGIADDGAVHTAARRSRESLTDERGLGIFPKSRLVEPTDYLLLGWHQGEVRRLLHQGESLVGSFVQPWPGGVLLAGARCYWRAGGAEQNAVALGWDGQELGRFTLGDGIQDVRVGADGTIWVSYFDEGVFGNFGWGDPGPAPIGQPGLVAFSPDGQLRFSFDAETADTDTICDAYAMNVTGSGEVWVYFYTEFPLVRIQDGHYTVWSCPVAGARALAVEGERALLLGDYERPGRARLLELGSGGGAARLAGELAIVDEQGHPLGGEAVIGGVGGALYFFRDRQVLVAELASVESQKPARRR